MALLHDIQSAATDSDTRLPDLLRKTRILARRLGSSPLEQWVRMELNGYGLDDDLPSYRVLHTQSRGTFAGIGMQSVKLPIPTEALPETGTWRAMATTVYLRESVAHYCETLASGGDTLGARWSTEAIGWVQHNLEIYSGGLVLQSAWREVTRANIAATLDSVRSRILDFALDLEEQFPDAGEPVAPGTTPIPRESVAQIINNTIFQGGHHNVAIGSSNVTQSLKVRVSPGDLESLQAAFRNLGVSKEDVTGLEEALASDSTRSRDGGIGPATRRWITIIAGKIAGGALEWTGAGLAGDVVEALEEPIKGFLGLAS